jgi:hypothetical protein
LCILFRFCSACARTHPSNFEFVTPSGAHTPSSEHISVSKPQLGFPPFEQKGVTPCSCVFHALSSMHL